MTTPMTRRHSLAACFGLMAAAAGPARAGLLDALSGKGAPDLGPPGQRSWQIAEFSAIRLVAREAGSAPNLHPAALEAEALRARLAAVQATVQGKAVALFDVEELQELLPFLLRALSLATPADDVLLLSTYRRGGSLAVPLGVTARLFMREDGLHLIVHHARLDFVQAYRRSRMLPQFTHGSRERAASVQLHAGGALSRRDDWLVLAADTTPAVAARPVAATPKPGPAPNPAMAPDGGDEVEAHLLRLKRLRAKDLISEEEYQQMRREVLLKLR